MPKRMLRDWTDSLRFDGITAEAERLFIRLIMKADDFGRFYAEPRLLKVHCLPLVENLRPPDVSRWLDELSTRGLILRYEADSRPYLAIVNFGQRLNQAKPKFPPKPGEDRLWLPVSDDFRESPGGSGDIPLEEKGREDEVGRGMGGGTPPPAEKASPSPPAGGSRRVSKGRAEELRTLVMSLRPAWFEMGPFSDLEETHFQANLHILDSWRPELWSMLGDYLAARLREGSGGWQPKGRIKFLEAPGELVPHAAEWDDRRPKPKPKPTATTTDPAEEATPDDWRKIFGKPSTPDTDEKKDVA